MTDKALPIVVLNLCGEMIYVIQQRLEAQSITNEKSNKVIYDILCAMFNEQFINELFKPQHMYSRSAMLAVFEKLVHSSIMRLNTNSMSKLYDLMLMVFKFQVLNCLYPTNLLLLTLNHLDAMRNCAISNPDLKSRIESVHFMLISNYKDLPLEDYESLYSCITAFLDDLNIKVSVLMKMGLQSSTGEIIIVKNKQQMDKKVSENLQDCNLSERFLHTSLELNADRGTILGSNLYLQYISMQSSEMIQPLINSQDPSENLQAVDELTFLSRLIGKFNQSDIGPEIHFSTGKEEKEYCQSTSSKDASFVNISASKMCQEELRNISNDLCLSEEDKKCDIMELLDIAEKEV